MIKPGRIVVIGGNAAGAAAAAKAKRVNPNAKVIIFEAGDFISTGTCEIPYVLSGEIKNYEDIIYYSAENFHDKKGVNVFVNNRVEQINRKNKTIAVRNLLNEEVVEHPYDSLVLATGSYSKSLPGLSSELKNVFQLKNISDLIGLKNYLEKNSSRTAAIIGSGYIGIEVSEALIKNNVKVTIVEREELPMPGAEAEISEKILTELVNHSVRFTGRCKNIEPYIQDDNVVSIKCNDDLLETDLVIISAGISPNVRLAESSKLDIGNFGGIKVDKKLGTSDRNIFAAGDNIEFINAITRKPDYFPFATYAHNFGHIAGENAAGGNANADPIIKNVSVRIFNNYFASVGLNSKEAEKNMFKTGSVMAEVPNVVRVMPESRSVFGKLNFNKENGQILGASFFGGKEVSGYADLIASGIYSGQKISYLEKINYNYTPPLSPFINLLSVLGRKAVTQINK
jgi:NADPH-dependent 2,4-dienoyl-CoA reductase/sulfur reductase-like enzyme